ncbi:MAG TPA: M42 family peptidase [Thermoleophilia bacterium]
MSADAELLRALCLAPGPTGFEAPAQEVVRRRLASLGRVQDDPLGNVWLDVGPAGGPQVVVTAHVDQIGLIVTYVDDQGYLSVAKIGGLAPLLVPGRHFVVHGAGGPVHAVGGKKPTHLIPTDERDKAPALDEQFLDIGASSRDDALLRVAAGDPITFAPDFIELSPGVFGTQALDDRGGVYCVVRALELYAAAPGAARLTGLSAVHEETTSMGAKAQAKRLTPAVIIVVDGDFCSDTPAVDAKKVAGEVKLGAGPVLGRGAGSNHRLLALAREVAAAEDIRVQIKAAPEAMSTDADELMAAGTAATLSLSFPVRYMHSPFEVAHGGDLEAVAHLVAALARRVGEAGAAESFVPRI